MVVAADLATGVEERVSLFSQWLYVLFMAGGMLFFLRWARDPKGLPREAYSVVIAILGWSGLWHLVMALGGGQAEVGGRPVHWARYLDWMITAPLLVVALSLTATHAGHDKRRKLLAMMIVASFVMIFCGFLADLISDPSARFAVYGVGMLPLLVLFGLIWGPLRASAMRQPRPMASLYTTLAILLGGLWTGFPLVWILGPSGIDILDDAIDTVLFLILSVLMKVGWSLMDIGGLRRLADRGELAVR